MEFELYVAVHSDGGDVKTVSLGAIKVEECPQIATMGLALADAKVVLARLQTEIVTRQIERLSARERPCPCGAKRIVKDYHDVRYRSLFGDVVTRIPRWRACACTAKSDDPSLGPRQRWIAAELEFVQSQLAFTIPYARAADLLRLLLPVATGNAASTVRERILHVGRRLDAQGRSVHETEVQGDATVTTVGLDSGYVRHCRPNPERSFEVVAGRAMRPGLRQRSVAFARIADRNSRERMRSWLAPFGTANASLEVFTDGDAQLRQWQKSTLPGSTPVLDQYHLRRRLEKLSDVVHGRTAASQLKPADHDHLSRLVGGVKWRLWHGRAGQAIKRLESIGSIMQRSSLANKGVVRQIRTLTVELLGYLKNNADSLPDYGRRYRSGRRISSAFVESAVNPLIDKRMSKSQQMRWDPHSAHLLLQVRVRVIDGQFRDDFSRWYPTFPSNDSTMSEPA